MSLKGKEYWKSLDQLAETKEFKKFLHREFPEGASELEGGMSRRKFFTLMGASMAFAGLVSCRRPVEKIVPYVKAPEEIIPGIPLFYATTMPFGTSSYGIVVKSNEGRPTKIEGNPIHPSSMGPSNVFMQASLLNLYDPDRSQKVLNNGAERDWPAFVQYWRELYPTFIDNKGERLAVLSESFASPTCAKLKDQFKATFPNATWATYEPVSDENIIKGTKVATGGDYVLTHSFEKAKVILSLDSDFLNMENENVVNASGFAAGRNVENVQSAMNRLYMAESTFSVTGSMADHRLRLKSSLMLDFALALNKELIKLGVQTGIHSLPSHGHFDQTFIIALAKDLAENKGESLIIAGSQQPPEVHALVLAINSALGNLNKTASLKDSKNIQPADIDGTFALKDKIDAGLVDTIFILGGNPVYNAPADLKFRPLLRKVKNSIHLCPSENETSKIVSWHVPQSHYLESWGDARSVNGTTSVIQPLIRPLFESKSIIELLNVIVFGSDVPGYDLVRENWQSIIKTNFEKNWKKVLHDGLLESSALDNSNVSIKTNRINENLAGLISLSKKTSKNDLEIVFKPSPSTFDGRFANNGWLMELPHSATKLTWDNAACMSLKTAKEFNVENEDLIQLSVNGKSLNVVVWILPGQADNSISIDLGFGQQDGGRVANGVGFNAYKIRTSKNLYFGNNVKLTKLNRKYNLANVQDHWSMEGRPLIREATLNEYKHEPNFAKEMVEHPPLKNLWKDHSYDEGYQWGMSIDLNTCIGCNACTIACQSENNIPVIGKEQVRDGREMHWIRLDRYFNGGPNDPEMVFQPMACQHCENAPCEQVCPVQATSHSKDGLNVMTYNRCVGTRYCSNNCPYKVRRFNFFNYTKDLPELVQMAQNPDVTVRSRGVMEKCTYCLQRINSARINAKNDGREIKDGEVTTACQQACPTKAIKFGNINDPQSDISEAKKNDRRYELLAELNVRPRTFYLAKIRNPNPKLQKADNPEKNHHD
jgi:MoCo/4Fe-4S cofactor protein with predicted Tat translocation signal